MVFYFDKSLRGFISYFRKVILYLGYLIYCKKFLEKLIKISIRYYIKDFGQKGKV